jgi:hypothetical protein
MLKSFVQLIAIANDHILLSCNEGPSGEELSLITLCEVDVNNGINILKEQLNSTLNLEIDHCFRFSRELIPGAVTFWGQTVVKKLQEVRGYRWVPLKEAKNINSIGRHLTMLYSECVDRDYEPQWMDTLERVLESSSSYRYSIYNINKKRQSKIVDREDKKICHREKMTGIILALILGIVFDRFFTERVAGISYPVFISLLIGFFFWTLRKDIKLRRNIGYLLLAPILLLSLTFAIFTNEILRFLNIILIPFFMVCSSIIIKNDTIPWHKAGFISKMFERTIPFAFENFLKPFKFIKADVKQRSGKGMSETKKSVLKGLLISLPLLIIIIALLSSADMVFQHYISNMTRVFDNLEIDFGRTFFHIIVILFTALYLFGYVWSFKYTYRNTQREEKNEAQWEAVTILTIIFLINIVYLIFTVIQFSYLYGGGTNALPEGYTYAEYARKGFFELVTVTVINFAMLLSSMKYMNKDKGALNNAAKILLTLLVLFTLNMLFSAHYKMSLYEATYGLTYLRVFVHYFMLLLFILFTMSLTAIWYTRFPLTKAILITSLIMYVVLNYLNVDAIIARSNIRRYQETGKIDVEYFRSLSQEVVPYMAELQDDKDPMIRSQIRAQLEVRKNRIDSISYWTEYNYYRDKARRSLKDIK